MAYEPQSNPSLGALIGTSVAAQTFGAACAVVFLAYHHLPETGNGVDTKMLEDALTVIFSTGCSVVGMVAHFIVVKFLTIKT